MQSTTEMTPGRATSPSSEDFNPGRLVIALGLFALLVLFIWGGFVFLRDAQRGDTLPKLLTAAIAIIWGVGGAAGTFYTLNMIVEQLPGNVRRILLPYVFVGPAVLFLGWALFFPTIRTFYLSFLDASSTNFVGIDNYLAVFTERSMQTAFRNNIFFWMIFGTAGCVVAGLIIAVLADRSSFETLAKSLIFMPMAISFVGAGVIWRFIYYYSPPGQPQIGLLNALVTDMGFPPQAWTTLLQPQNNFFLVIILVWMQTGFAMVIFSAAIKGIPDDVLEAARVDGANEIQIFWSIMLPAIQGTIVTVTTTILIVTLKIFDIVIVMTGGQYGTNVIAVEFYRQYFSNRNFGYGSAVAIVLLIAVIPVMVYNLRQIRKQEVF
ncbi:sugar ABC transporter permease [Candidatus Chloroploca sp. M-50]|uniref:Sugar ABC transporter permease n=2 Tax=Candidatus Chloroploca mongolica TaxID=2528176 RepID=A0ABS4D5Y6_9CHLR|nr:sugar ABC transporter permease [Candidatus Chloroploca mongolica]MBP1464850.1 sugar ABC transporter permease [Candidatus Chloroploca mongolica]